MEELLQFLFHRAENEEHFSAEHPGDRCEDQPCSSGGCPGSAQCPGRGRGSGGEAEAAQGWSMCSSSREEKGMAEWLHPSAQRWQLCAQLCWNSARQSFVLRGGCSFKKGLLSTNISHSIPSTQPALPTVNLKPSWTPAQVNSPHCSVGQSFKTTIYTVILLHIFLYIFLWKYLARVCRQGWAPSSQRIVGCICPEMDWWLPPPNSKPKRHSDFSQAENNAGGAKK